MSTEAKFSENGVARPPPFDSYCPSMEDKLDGCVCEKCGSSWPSAAAMKRHLKAHSPRNITNESTIEYQEVTDEVANLDAYSIIVAVSYAVVVDGVAG